MYPHPQVWYITTSSRWELQAEIDDREPPLRCNNLRPLPVVFFRIPLKRQRRNSIRRCLLEVDVAILEALMFATTLLIWYEIQDLDIDTDLKHLIVLSHAIITSPNLDLSSFLVSWIYPSWPTPPATNRLWAPEANGLLSPPLVFRDTQT